MSLVAYTITALEETFANSQSSGKNIVVGAVCSMYSQPSDTVVTLYDDAAGSNGSTAKTTGADGQVVVYINQGRYRLSVNGSDSFITVSSDVPIDIDTFAGLELLSPIQDGQRFICQERANAEYILQASGYVALAGDVTFTNGRVAALQLIDTTPVEFFGAVGDRVADDTIPIQNAIDRMTANNGGKLSGKNRYRTTDTITLNGESVELCGLAPQRVFTNAISINDKGLIYSDFTDGPAVLIADGGSTLKGFTILGSDARRAAAITTGAQNVNCGVLIEPLDDGSDIIQHVEVKNVFCSKHPADGLLIEGDVTNVSIDDFYSSDTGRHGIAMSEGDISGRSNKKACGIIYIKKGKSFDCGGNGIAIGTPTSGSFPYRVTIINREGYRNASDVSTRYSTANNFIVGQNITAINCAFGGSGDGNTPDHEGLEVGGRDITLLDSRFVSCQDNYVIIRQQAGLNTQNINIDGGICTTVGATPPADFATIAAGIDGLKIIRVLHDGSNPITDISVGSTNNDITLHDLDENLTVHANHVDDFSNSNMIRNNNGGSLSITSANVTVEYEGFYTVDTEGDTASDDLVSILGGNTGDQIIIRQENSGRTITVKDGTGNIRLAGSADYVFPSTGSYLKLMRDGSNWQEISRSEN